MDKKISICKLNILLISSLWSIITLYGIFSEFGVQGFMLYMAVGFLSAVLFICLYRKLKPLIKKLDIYEDSMAADGMTVSFSNITGIYEVGPVGKMLFAVKSPEYDYTTSLCSKGIVIRTLYGSILADDFDLNHTCRIKRHINIKSQIIFVYLISSIPVIISFISYGLSIEPLWYVLSMFVFVFIVLLRLTPLFYLGQKLDPFMLPLRHDEALEFRRICLIKGFILSDRLPVIPFRRNSKLDGLAFNIFFKKYIILNSRLFLLGSEDYLRFVLFHELSHIKHHDGTGAIAVPVIIAAIDFFLSVLSLDLGILDPYYDYILLGIAAIYIAYTVLTRKKIEKRADRYGISRIGDIGLENIKKDLGIDLKHRA